MMELVGMLLDFKSLSPMDQTFLTTQKKSDDAKLKNEYVFVVEENFYASGRTENSTGLTGRKKSISDLEISFNLTVSMSVND